MLGATDWAGIGACITAFFGGCAALVSAILTAKVHTEVKNPNGTTTGQSIESIRQTVGAPEMPTDTHSTSEPAA